MNDQGIEAWHQSNLSDPIIDICDTQLLFSLFFFNQLLVSPLSAIHFVLTCFFKQVHSNLTNQFLFSIQCVVFTDTPNKIALPFARKMIERLLHAKTVNNTEERVKEHIRLNTKWKKCIQRDRNGKRWWCVYFIISQIKRQKSVENQVIHKKGELAVWE